MSRRVVITLTEAEYATLEAQATAERRTPREHAAYLVTRPSLILSPQEAATRSWPPNVWSGGTTLNPGVNICASVPLMPTGSINHNGTNIIELKPGASLSAAADG